MPERPGASTTPEPDEPPLRAGTWQPRPRARHARPPADADDDPLRLAPGELPWGVPTRAAGHDGADLPPATVLANRGGRARALIVVAVAVVILLALLVVLRLVR